MTEPSDDIQNLGPLRPLAGTWEGSKGKDVAPSDDRKVAKSDYRERMVFEPIGRVDNHEQVLYGLRYATTAWRLGADAPFHEEVGYWLWDAANQQVTRCFIVPRGVSVIAGGTVAADATQFSLTAELGSATYGICSNPFLDAEFKTIRYELAVTTHGPDAFGYEEVTHLALKGRSDVFRHTDGNSMHRVPPSP